MDAVGSVGTEVNRLGQVFQIEQEVGLGNGRCRHLLKFCCKETKRSKGRAVGSGKEGRAEGSY